jgi:hypothetical protein
MGWAEAQRTCETWGGNLASINTKAEQKVVQSLIQPYDRSEYWLGLKVDNNDLFMADVNRGFSWIDQSKVSFTNFNIFKSAMGVNYDQDRKCTVAQRVPSYFMWTG